MGVLINNNNTTALERTAALAKGGRGSNASYWYQMFALDSAVDVAQNVKLAWRLQAAKTTVTSHGEETGGTDLESLQSSTTPDPGYHMGK